MSRGRIVRWLVLCGLFFVVLLMMNWFVRQMVYPAPGFPVPSSPPPMKEVSFPLSSGGSVVGWVFENPSSSNNTPVLLYFHGNAENLETLRLSGLLDLLVRLKVHFVAVDYPGYGRSSGRPSEARILAASDAAMDWIARQYPSHPKVSCGWSLGAAVAIQTAARHPKLVDGLIAMSAWTSLPDTAAEHFPRWLTKLLLQEKYDSLEACKQIRCPALLIHGEDDTLIPMSQGKKIASSLSSPTRWVQIPGTGHNDLLSHSQVWTEIAAFLKEL